MWYTGKYRRHLCDMHIDEWDDSFLSEFDADAYYNNLKIANVQSAMIYLQSHVGLCNFPTKVGKMHKAFVGREYTMKYLIEKCRNNGIDVVGYYSLVYNTLEHDRHPEWRLVHEMGRSRRVDCVEHADGASFASGRYGLCCPNNPEYREFVLKQIDEMAEYAKVDGMFYDMTFWPHYCHCKYCKERYAKEVGGEMPLWDFKPTEEWNRYVKKRLEWMAEFANLVTAYTKEKMPGVSVEHNVAHAVTVNNIYNSGKGVCDACDYVGGDLYGTSYLQSFACKFYSGLTKNQPYEYMFSRCEPTLGFHTLTKSYERTLSSVMLTCANHGATLFIDAIDPVGTQDVRVYEQIGKIFEYESKYEKYIRGELIADVGIFFGLLSKFEDNSNPYCNGTCARKLSENFVKFNVPHGVVSQNGDFDKYKVIFVPQITDEETEDTDRIIEYIRNGGNIIFSGARNTKLINVLLGVECTEYSKSNSTYLAPKSGYEDLFGGFSNKYPLQIPGYIPLVDNVKNGEVIATVKLPYTNNGELRFASIHSNPPGIDTDYPAVIEGRYGNGKFIWLAHCPEICDEYQYTEIMINLIRRLIGSEFPIVNTSPEDVEVIGYKDDKEYFVSAVLLNDSYHARNIYPFSISVKVDAKVKDVLLLPNETHVDFIEKNGYVSFDTDNFHIFDMFKIVTE